MKSTTAARRYSKALFSLSRDLNVTAEIRAELGQLSELVRTDVALRRVLMTPLYPAAERKAVVGQLAQRAGLSETLKRFLWFLIDQRRLLSLAVIQEEYERLANEASGLVTAQVVAASELDERKQDRLRRALSERTGQEVRLDITVDPSLIGGAVATVGDMVFDGSIRTQLERLRSNLTKGS
jgi:F-type H+-transporting ATPase subunit delta